MRRDVRWIGGFIALASVVVLGLIFHFSGSEKRARDGEFDLQFKRAAIALHAREYEHAAAALHQLLQAAPQVPELHVNMGYAMLGLKKHAAARDFFQGAIELRPAQANAYFGLAESLEALGDLRGALGAMRTYVHLSPPDDPFLRKANSAIWEWESALAPESPAK